MSTRIPCGLSPGSITNKTCNRTRTDHNVSMNTLVGLIWYVYMMLTFETC